VNGLSSASPFARDGGSGATCVKPHLHRGRVARARHLVWREPIAAKSSILRPQPVAARPGLSGRAARSRSSALGDMPSGTCSLTGSGPGSVARVMHSRRRAHGPCPSERRRDHQHVVTSSPDLSRELRGETDKLYQLFEIMGSV